MSGGQARNQGTDLGRNVTNNYKTVTFDQLRVYAVFDFAFVTFSRLF